MKNDTKVFVLFVLALLVILLGAIPGIGVWICGDSLTLDSVFMSMLGLFIASGACMQRLFCKLNRKICALENIINETKQLI